VGCRWNCAVSRGPRCVPVDVKRLTKPLRRLRLEIGHRAVRHARHDRRRVERRELERDLLEILGQERERSVRLHTDAREVVQLLGSVRRVDEDHELALDRVRVADVQLDATGRRRVERRRVRDRDRTGEDRSRQDTIDPDRRVDYLVIHSEDASDAAEVDRERRDRSLLRRDDDPTRDRRGIHALDGLVDDRRRHLREPRLGRRQREADILRRVLRDRHVDVEVARAVDLQALRLRRPHEIATEDDVVVLPDLDVRDVAERQEAERIERPRRECAEVALCGADVLVLD
jgi:hypothetical protein